MVILTYCMAVPVPQVPVSPDSHKNLVNVSWLVRLYVMVLDCVYWHPDREASEWIGVLAKVMKLNSLALLAHHPILWNHNKKSDHPARKARTFTVLFFSVHWCVDTYSAWVTTDLSFTDYLYYCSNGKLSIWRIISLTQDPYPRHLHDGWFDLIQKRRKIYIKFLHILELIYLKLLLHAAMRAFSCRFKISFYLNKIMHQYSSLCINS